MARRERWMTRLERNALREGVAEAGGIKAWKRASLKRRPISDEERARHEAANNVADKFGFPRPYPDLNLYPRAEP